QALNLTIFMWEFTSQAENLHQLTPTEADIASRVPEAQTVYYGRDANRCFFAFVILKSLPEQTNSLTSYTPYAYAPRHVDLCAPPGWTVELIQVFNNWRKVTLNIPPTPSETPQS